MSLARVVIVGGGINVDIVMEVKRMPGPGESVRGDSITRYPGGKAANTAVAVHRASHRKPRSNTVAAAVYFDYRKQSARASERAVEGSAGSEVEAKPETAPAPDDDLQDIQVYLNGAVGRDDNGSWLTTILSNAGINTSQIQILDDTETATAVVTVEKQTGESRCIAFLGATKKWRYDPEETSLSQMADGGGADSSKPDLVICHLSMNFSEIEQVLFAARREGVEIILNPSPAAATTPLEAEVYAILDHLILNESETEILWQRQQHRGSLEGSLLKWEDWVFEAAEFFLSQGVGNVVITLGAKGACYASKNGERGFVQAQSGVVVKDATGAGDTFTGAYAVDLIQQKRRGQWVIRDAVERACKAAAQTVQRLGAQEAMPWADEIM